MVNWTAVVVGFLVEVVVGTIGLAVPVLGQLTAALLGGVVAGYMVGGSLGNGAWHGLLAGAFGGLVIALVVGVLGSVALSVGVGPPGFLAGLGATALFVAFWLLVSVPSAVGGVVGAAVA
ncbi:DUF5518 domain-containing protein [Halomarina oriensis]|uniref:DUF5518 domain-containing protein n=1 Tax=Halomarina oriensis TaxID=671145 RepID=A0A6B0GPN5_9EURY|nr:DUF5518 domain-containing protein [Halomarina oriensis]MWG35519.1 hypothetical protein [Halomarina oriensis]